MPEFMPMVVPHANAGTLIAVGAVTGTRYEIYPTGTWVYLEDLPGLLAELRACCPQTDAPVRAFYLVNPTSENAVPYTPWPGAQVPTGVVATNVWPIESAVDGDRLTPGLQTQTEESDLVPNGPVETLTVGMEGPSPEEGGSDEAAVAGEAMVSAPAEAKDVEPPTHRRRKNW